MRGPTVSRSISPIAAVRGTAPQLHVVRVVYRQVLQVGSVAEQPLPVSHAALVHCTLMQAPFGNGHFTSHAHD